MENDIKVSVIMPVYNVRDYLEECVQSVLNQTLDKIEIILVDDGSNDGSEVMCDELANKYTNIRVFHKANGGQGSARNIGIKKCVGKYIYFLDSDDYIEPNALEKLFTLAEKELLDVIFFAADVFSDDSEVMHNVSRFKYEHSTNLLRTMTGKDAFISMYKNEEYHTSLPIRFYRSEYIKENNFLFVENQIHEDEDFGIFSCVKASKIMIIDNKFFHRRLRSNSTMTSKRLRKTCQGYQYAFTSIKDFIDECDWKDEEKLTLKKYISNFLYAVMSMSYRVADEEYNANRDALKEFIECVRVYRCFYDMKTRLFMRFPKLFRVIYKLKNMNRK